LGVIILKEISRIEDIVSKPYSVYVIGEMGVGKSILLKLLRAYETHLLDFFGLEGKLFHTFEEEMPNKELWERYKYHKDNQIPDMSIYDTQIHFARKKRINMFKSAGRDSEGKIILPDPRTVGFYFVDRSLHEDRYVFAEELKQRFPDGKYEEYVEEVDTYISEAPTPDLIIRLCVERPEVSQLRVLNRGWGEKLPLSRYHQMAEDYQQYINPWIRNLGVPVINIRTDMPHFDFYNPPGQNYFLLSLLSGLKEKRNKDGEPFWLLPSHIIPDGMLINPNEN
jgi:hypothetical protein